jgi:hypothetical protein
MNCCGGKRKKWLNEVKSSVSRTTIDSYKSYPDDKDKPYRVFEYTGNESLYLIGSYSGKPYNFKFQGHKLKVTYNDSFAMLSERDLKIVISDTAELEV